MVNGNRQKEVQKRRQFSDEYKAGAVQLVLVEGKSVSGTAKDLGLAGSVLSRWVEQARANRGTSQRKGRCATPGDGQFPER